MAYRVARGRLGSAEGEDALDVWEHIAFAEWLAEHPRPSTTYFHTYEGEAEVVENVPESDALSEWELTDIDDFESMGEEDW